MPAVAREPETTIQAMRIAVEHLPPGALLSFAERNWQDFEALLASLGDHRRTRVHYDNGRIDVMSPSGWHDYYKSLLARLIEVITEELDLEFISYGSATLKQKKKAKGLEPDDCFYITSAARLIGKSDDLNLENDPPPDLAVEIDMWHPSHSKFAIYAALGVPEIWRYRKGKLHFYRLADGAYTEIATSDLFPFLAPAVLADFLREDYVQNFNQVKREFRAWVRAHKPA